MTTEDEFVDAMLDLFGMMDIELHDFPEGIQDYHRRVAKQMGVTLPDEVPPCEH